MAEKTVQSLFPCCRQTSITAVTGAGSGCALRLPCTGPVRTGGVRESGTVRWVQSEFLRRQPPGERVEEAAAADEAFSPRNGRRQGAAEAGGGIQSDAAVLQQQAGTQLISRAGPMHGTAVQVPQDA